MAEAPLFTLDDLLGAPAPPEDPHAREDDAHAALLEAQVLGQFQSRALGLQSFPALALRAMDLVQKPNVEFRELAALVGQDPAMVAGVLRAANSAKNSRGNPAKDLLAALTRLGLDEVTGIVVGLAGQALFDPEASAEYKRFTRHWNALFHHAMTCGLVAAQAARTLRRGQSARAFLGGLFHDIGKTVGLRSVCALVKAGQLSIAPEDHALLPLLERVHLVVGVEVLAAWKLPDWLRTLCQHHHDDLIPAGKEHDDLHLVRAASALSLLRQDAQLHRSCAPQAAASLQALGVGPRELVALRELVDRQAAKVAVTYNIPDPAQKAQPAAAESIKANQKS